MWSFVRPFVRSFVRPFVRSFARSFVRSFTRSLVPSFPRSLSRSLVRLFVRSLARSFVRLFARLLFFFPTRGRWFVRSIICLFTFINPTYHRPSPISCDFFISMFPIPYPLCIVLTSSLCDLFSISSSWLWSYSSGRPEGRSTCLWKQGRGRQVLHHEEISLALNYFSGV